MLYYLIYISQTYIAQIYLYLNIYCYVILNKFISCVSLEALCLAIYVSIELFDRGV